MYMYYVYVYVYAYARARVQILTIYFNYGKEQLTRKTHTTTDGFNCNGIFEGLERNDDVSAGKAPPGSGLPLAKLNNA